MLFSLIPCSYIHILDIKFDNFRTEVTASRVGLANKSKTFVSHCPLESVWPSPANRMATNLSIHTEEHRGLGNYAGTVRPSPTRQESSTWGRASSQV